MEGAAVLLLFGAYAATLRLWWHLGPASYPGSPLAVILIVLPVIVTIYHLRAWLEARDQRRAGLPVVAVRHPFYWFDFDRRILWIALALLLIGFSAVALVDATVAGLRLR